MKIFELFDIAEYNDSFTPLRAEGLAEHINSDNIGDFDN